MSRHLCISVTLLDPMFHGQGDAGPEWPPSPLRVYQALLAGARTGCRGPAWSEAHAEAFRWLGARSEADPPAIVAPEARPADGLTMFVPNNDGDKEFDRQKRLTGKSVRPHHMLVDDTAVHYLWRIEEADWPAARPHAELLCREARHLMALGWGIDVACADGQILDDAEAERLAGARNVRWKPLPGSSPAGRKLRVPSGSTLEDLERVYRSFCERIVEHKRYTSSLPLRQFKPLVYVRKTALPRRPCACFEFPSEDGALPQTAAIEVAAMLRSRACAEAQRDTHDFPGGSERYVAGHVNHQAEAHARFSYLPLPTIGHDHADGMIRRVLIAEPYGGDGTHARWAQDRLLGAMMTDHRGRSRTLLERWRESDVWTLYLGESRAWSSVTPVILPGHDDHDPRKKAPRLLLKAVEQAGIPPDAIEDFHLRKAPHWPGSQHPRSYRRPDYLQHYSSWHVWFHFRETIPGPLAIGAGRHCGLGLLATSR